MYSILKTCLEIHGEGFVDVMVEVETISIEARHSQCEKTSHRLTKMGSSRMAAKLE